MRFKEVRIDKDKTLFRWPGDQPNLKLMNELSLTLSLPMSTPVNIWCCRQVQACDVIGFDATKSLVTATCVS